MLSILYIFAKTVQVIISVVSFAMLLRAILPFFLNVEESRVFALCCLISEPFVAPVRFVMVKLNIGQGSPIDWSFFVTYLLLWLLESFLPVI
ncbi:MAG: YggT family protein [Clostridia bacterium]|nr:YggT family protein [Clostridia bacterium]